MRRFHDSGLPTQSLEVRDSSGTETLAREHADFDFRLIEPTSVSRRGANGEPAQDFAADRRAVKISQGLAAELSITRWMVSASGY